VEEIEKGILRTFTIGHHLPMLMRISKKLENRRLVEALLKEGEGFAII
jgi:mannitol/fructose-specific phosphotransferase system IIA component (Ntr-type)